MALRELLDSEEFSFRFDAGVSTASSAVTIDDKNHLASAFLTNFLISSCKGELDQLREGLSHLDVLEVIRDYPSLVLMKPLLLVSGKPTLTTKQLLDLFKVIWSPEGLNSRVCEEAVIFGWTTYVDSCGGN